MSNIVVFENDVAKYYESVDASEYTGAVVNPDISSLANVPTIYWVKNNGGVREMTLEEKEVVDSSILQAKKDSVVLSIGFKALLSLLLDKGVSVSEEELLTRIKEGII